MPSFRSRAGQTSLALLTAATATAAATLAHAADLLPYSARTRSYSGWNTSVSGDVRTVGTAGATVGLPNTFLASVDNPSGLALLMDTGDNNFTSNRISDGHVQNRDHPIETISFGLALANYPWAFSAGYVTTSREGQNYALPTGLGEPAASVDAHEFKFGVSRVFFNGRFSIGGSFNLGVATEKFDYDSDTTPNVSARDYAVGATLGAIFQVRDHLLIGASYVPSMTYSFADDRTSPAPIPGFFQPLVSPERFAVGAGWIPNRHFYASASTHIVGRTPGAALLGNQRIMVGQDLTVQPRLGAAYILAEFQHFKATAFAGTYFEMSRIEGASNRLHATGGIETKLWIFTIGAGADLSANYSHLNLGVSIDPFKVLEKLDLIPTPYSPARAGWFPPPHVRSDEGLPRSLVRHWKPQGPAMDPIQIIKDMPERTVEKYEEVKEIFVSKPKPKPQKNTKKKKKKKKKTK